MRLTLAEPRPPRRRPGLTPMIDVVFLLLVFFMLAARFGQPGALALSPGGAGDIWQGPPRLVVVHPGGVTLNGRPLDEPGLPAALAALKADPADPVVLRAGPATDLQRLVAVLERLEAAGLTTLVLAE